jgi:N-acyl-D-amino-acid deacylase
VRRFLAGSLVFAAACVSAQTILIENASVLDGLGTPARAVSVRISLDKVDAVGDLKPVAGERVIDAKGLVLAPGFIDVHNHSDRGLAGDPSAASQISQGITTLVVGVDGGSALPIADWFAQRRRNPAAVNVMTFVGHATVRSRVMGNDYRRAATAAEIAKMADLVEQGMRDGALGLSTGLEYEVGSYSSTEEVIALARAAAKYGGIYVSHVRDESDLAFDSFREVIRIASEAHIPCHISHIKLGTVAVWNKAREAVRMIDEARAKGLDITADFYPYDAWSSTITVLVPNKKYSDRPSVQKALDDVGGPQNVTIINCQKHPDYEFKNLKQIAELQKTSAVDVFIAVVKDGGASVVGHAMTEADMREFFVQPWVMIASDGGIGMRHPRAAGTFPRVLGRYVRDEHWVDLPEAVRKMTSLPATRVGLKDRGVIRAGAKADLVLFDPRTVSDQSTFPDPGKLSVGIAQVFVNGQLVWDSHRATVARPGSVLVRP